MSRSRWQPPHADPAKGTTRDTPPSERRQRAALVETTQPLGRRCSWDGCIEYQEPNYRVGLCGRHAHIVRNAMNAYDDETLRLRADTAAMVADELEATAAKINAGIRVTHGDTIPGYVYYLQIDDTIKIGYAANVTSRMRSYPPTAKLLAVEPGTKHLEHLRHGHFDAYRVHGREWFRADATELLTWIDTLVAEYGKPTGMAYRYTTPQASKQVTIPKGYRGYKKTAA
jgi:hypothetical protein